MSVGTAKTAPCPSASRVTVHQLQRGALIFGGRMKCHIAAAVRVESRARHGGGDLARSPEFFRAGGDVQRMQPVKRGAFLQGHGGHTGFGLWDRSPASR